MTGDSTEPRPSSADPRWAEAIAIANCPTLLMLLVQMTGDLRWLRDPYRPTRTQGIGDNDSGGFPRHIQDEIRREALAAVRAWLDSRPLAVPVPSDELMVEMLSVSVGEQVPAEYASMIAQRVDPPKAAPRAAAPSGFSVIIIGAGMSGLCAAVQLRNAGIPYTILERHDSVGGTWLENRYPGCGVDVASHLYSFSFARNDWSKYYALRDELCEYFDRVADDFGVRTNIRFGADVQSAAYDAKTQRWAVQLANSDGSCETLQATVLISAVGAFNKPKFPPVKELDRFEGPSVHTAQWPPEGVDLAGKRVAVIGNGASAMQVVPEIAETVRSLVVFQRSKHWVAPFEKFKLVVPEPIKFLLRELPLYHTWYRLRLEWAMNDKVHPALQRDPSWQHPERAVNPINDGYRRFFTRYIVKELGGRQDLLDKVLPDYPPFGKRMLLDNGWYRAIQRDNVELVNDSVGSVGATSLTTSSGSTYDVDVLIWATGFDVVHFLAPMEIRGRSGRTIHEVWDGDDARAFLGTAVPDFPNFFCLYGPNTQFGHGGSLISVVERQMHYVMSVILQMLDHDLGAVEVRSEVHDEYNRALDEANAHMIWTHPGVVTYYKNSRGRVVVSNPFRIVEVWGMTERADLSQYRTEPAMRRASEATAASS